jgi:hypothetical protein
VIRLVIATSLFAALTAWSGRSALAARPRVVPDPPASATPSAAPTALPSPGPFPSPEPTPAATPPASPAPAQTGTPPAPQPTPQPPPPSPSPSPTPLPVATPSPAPSPAYHFTYTPPAQAGTGPRSLSIEMSDRVMHANSDVALRVLTSPDVTAVSVATLGHELAIPQTAAGVFAAQSHMPNVPFFMFRTYDVVFHAATADGRATTITLQVKLTR